MIQKLDEGVYATNDILEQIKGVDSVIFDCDGVLIDIRKSYDLTINKTVDYILEEFEKIKNPTRIDSDVIDSFKSSGGFNDEIDLTYAAIISISAASKKGVEAKKFLLEVAKNSDKSGIKSAEQYIEGLGIDISDIKRKLHYPSERKSNPLCTVFDQFFYGPELYSKLFGQKSSFAKDGFIENDTVIVTEELLDKLQSKFGKKIAVVSGRGYESMRYSIKDLIEKFDISSSAFLEDEPREMAKPNPESLLRAIKKMKSNHCLFVGDSVEDLIMAEKTANLGCKTTFCGIIGTSDDPQRKLGLFEKRGVNLVLDSIQDLPKVLNLV